MNSQSRIKTGPKSMPTEGISVTCPYCYPHPACGSRPRCPIAFARQACSASLFIQLRTASALFLRTDRTVLVHRSPPDPHPTKAGRPFGAPTTNTSLHRQPINPHGLAPAHSCGRCDGPLLPCWQLGQTSFMPSSFHGCMVAPCTAMDALGFDNSNKTRNSPSSPNSFSSFFIFPAQHFCPTYYSALEHLLRIHKFFATSIVLSLSHSHTLDDSIGLALLISLEDSTEQSRNKQYPSTASHSL
jgi:hypothetical protein